MGEWDREAVEDALRAGARYVGLVASPRRAGEMRRLLLARDWEEDELVPLVGPAGLDIGARDPAEIAISILAQLIQLRAEESRRHADRMAGAGRRSDASGPPLASPAGGEPGVAVDPICGMDVRIDGARHKLEHENRTYYFCCEGCKERFERDLTPAVDS